MNRFGVPLKDSLVNGLLWPVLKMTARITHIDTLQHQRQFRRRPLYVLRI